MYNYKFREEVIHLQEELKSSGLFKVLNIADEIVMFKLVANYKILNFGTKDVVKKRKKSFFLFLTLFLFYSTLYVLLIIILIFRKFKVPKNEKIFLADTTYATKNAFEFLNKNTPKSDIVFILSIKELFKTNLSSYHLLPIKFNFKGIKKVFEIAFLLRKVSIFYDLNFKDRLLTFIFFTIFPLNIEAVKQWLKSTSSLEKKTLIQSIDSSNLNLFLTLFSKEYNFKTLTILHGHTFDNNFFYLPPTTDKVILHNNYEKKIFSNYLPVSDIYVTGISLQLLLGKKLEISSQKIKYQILVLGAFGYDLDLNNYVSILRETSSVINCKSLLLRQHPGANLKVRELYEKINPYEISKDRTLNLDVSESDIIISFSIDSNFICLYNKKKVIFCSNEYDLNDYSEFNSCFINFRIVKNANELNEAIAFMNSLSDQDINTNDYFFKMRRFFGEYELEGIKKSFHDVFMQI